MAKASKTGPKTPTPMPAGMDHVMPAPVATPVPKQQPATPAHPLVAPVPEGELGN